MTKNAGSHSVCTSCHRLLQEDSTTDCHAKTPASWPVNWDVPILLWILFVLILSCVMHCCPAEHFWIHIHNIHMHINIIHTMHTILSYTLHTYYINIYITLKNYTYYEYTHMLVYINTYTYICSSNLLYFYKELKRDFGYEEYLKCAVHRALARLFFKLFCSV